MMIRRYSELIRIPDFTGRYDYLRLQGSVGDETFGYDRWINQRFYTSREWRRARLAVIARDGGCDLGIRGHEIYDQVFVHHMNPMTEEQIVHGDEVIFNPEFLITVSPTTHNAIHFGDERLLIRMPVARHPGDTALW
jgi:hypothetical protein